MTLKAVLFDLDNTLIDFYKMKRIACEEAVKAMIDVGLPLEFETAFDQLLSIYWEVGIDSDEAFSKFLVRFLGESDDRILAAGINAYMRVKDSLLNPYPSVIPTLIRLIKKGLKIGIVTDAPRLKAWQRLSAMRLQHFFDIVVTLDESGKPKPNERPYRIAMNLLNLKAEEILFIGDSVERDIKGAKKVGMKAGLAKYGCLEQFENKSAELLPDYILEEISDVIMIVESSNGICIEC